MTTSNGEEDDVFPMETLPLKVSLTWEPSY